MLAFASGMCLPYVEPELLLTLLSSRGDEAVEMTATHVGNVETFVYSLRSFYRCHIVEGVTPRTLDFELRSNTDWSVVDQGLSMENYLISNVVFVWDRHHRVLDRISKSPKW